MRIIEKGIRASIVVFLFLCCYTMQSTPDMRILHETLLMLGCIVIFGFMLKNLWVSAFLWWTVFLFGYYKFAFGSVYVTNVFCGCLLYYFCRRFFEKKHISFFVRGMLWLGVLNIFYMCLQLLDFDFIYRYLHYLQGRKFVDHNTLAIGFWGSEALLGCFICMLIPLMLSRRTVWGYIGGFGLLVPLYFAQSTFCGVVALIVILYCLFFVMDKRIWCGIVIGLVLLGGFYYIPKMGVPCVEGRLKVWKQSLTDYSHRWITGVGLDSFRNEVPHKKYRYLSTNSTFERYGKKSKIIQWWDNPHCMYITILYEFGIIGMILFIGYMRGLLVRFYWSIKTVNTVGLGGVVMVFLLVSLVHFPMQIARFTPLIVGSFALLENELT